MEVCSEIQHLPEFVILTFAGPSSPFMLVMNEEYWLRILLVMNKDEYVAQGT